MNESTYAPHRQPFLYLLAALVSGILADKFLEPPVWSLWVLLIPSFFGAVFFIYRKAHRVTTLGLLLGFVMVAALLAHQEHISVNDTRLQKLFEQQIITASEPVELTGVLMQPPEPAPEAVYLDVEAESLRIYQESLAASGRVKLFLATEDAQTAREFQELKLDYGSRIRVLVRLERARNYKNPGSVNFNEFLERQGYDLKGTIKSPLLIEVSGRASRNRWLAALFHFRLRAMQAIDARFEQPVAGTLKAMLLGSRYFLDAETSERLRESSTFHTLVISGMHIAIIAWLLLNLPFIKIFRNREAKGFFSITAIPRNREQTRRPHLLRVSFAFMVLWAYTLMVGLAPPVTRATVMISVGLLAPLLFRQAASLNTVSLAAFLMLALKPALVADPGFQLSFIAVAAIVTLAIPLVNKLKSIGEWRPSPIHPHPPACSEWLRAICEILFWDERAFLREMAHSPITFHLDKSPAAIRLNRWRVQWFIRWIFTLLITSTAIQLMTLPLMAFYFNRVAPVGVMLNIFSGVLTAVMMFAAILVIVLGTIKAGFAVPFIFTVQLAHDLLVHSIKPFLNIPAMTFRVAHYEGWQSIVYAVYFLPLGWLALMIDRWQPVKSVGSKQQAVGSNESASHATVYDAQAKGQMRLLARVKPLIAYCLLPTLFCMIFVIIHPPSKLPKNQLTIYFLDVGQGDAALVVFPQGTTMLIDGGGELTYRKKQPAESKKFNDEAMPLTALDQDAEEQETNYREPGFAVGESVVARFLWSLGLTDIDYVLATHADADHIGGLSEVMKNLQAREAIVGRVVSSNPEFDKFVKVANACQTPLAILTSGEIFEIDGVKIEVLHPQTATQAQEKANNTSIVLRLIYGSTAILMTGDIEKNAEAALLNSGVNLRAEVLKVPHHGSKTSSTDAFIDAVKPQLAILSVGERSRFGHPHKVVIERFLKRDVKLLQTGRSGMVTLQSDGATVQVTTYAP
ncbi:MAG: ComEC/Rec2 family competence protein [Acidobacteriota bacterium]